MSYDPIHDPIHGLGKLAEEHGDKVVPAGKALGPAFAADLADESGEAISFTPIPSVQGGFFNPLFWTVVALMRKIGRQDLLVFQVFWQMRPAILTIFF